MAVPGSGGSGLEDEDEDEDDYSDLSGEEFLAEANKTIGNDWEEDVANGVYDDELQK